MNQEESASPADPASTGGVSPAGEQYSVGQKLGAGRYTLIQALGRGGMGVVWLARDERLGDSVALKLLPPEIRSDPVALDDLRRETLKSRKLTHPNIIRIHDLCVAEGEAAFISMEYVEGPNLSKLRLDQPSRLFDWEFLAPLVRQLCDALEYAHGEKVIHRDLKPGNMMLDARGRLKLADFGIAATVSDSVSRVSLRQMTSGTPSFMSPQQMDGHLPRVTDDLYSLGATLYELLTSRPPFYTGDIAHQARNLPPQPIDERLADLELENAIPANVAALVMACLAKDPAQRPQSAREVAERLDRNWMPEPEPAPAPEPAPSGPPRLGLAAVVVVLLIGALGAIGLAVHKSHSHASGPATPTAGVPTAGALPTASAAGPPTAGAGLSTEGFSRIFNGKDYTGWQVPSVNPFWSIADGVLTARQPTPALRGYNLETDRAYDDFIFDFEFRYSPDADGAIAIRNGQNLFCLIGHYQNGRKDSTGLLFDYTKGHSLAPLKAGMGTPHPGDWNRMRIEARGSHFNLWLNGAFATEAEAAKFSDPAPILLKFWGKAGSEISFRNLLIKDLSPPGTLVSAPTSHKGTPVAGSSPPAPPAPVPAPVDSPVPVSKAKSGALTPGPLGSPDESFDPGAGFNGTVRGVAVQDDGRLLVGGDFDHFNNQASGNLVRLLPGGALEPGGEIRADALITDLAIQADHKVVIAGDFKSVSGVSRLRLARLNPDLSVDPTFNPGAGASGQVTCVAMQPDGRIVIAGSFTSYAGAARRHVARILPDGLPDPTFDPGAGPSSPVSSLALQADGCILVAGNFSSVDGTPCEGLARLKPDGRLDPILNVRILPKGRVRSVAVDSKGSIYVGGSFTNVAGMFRPIIARLSPVGSLDNTFKMVAVPGLMVRLIRPWPDGRVLVGGSVSGKGSPRLGVVLVTATGAFDPIFTRNAVVDGAVWAAPLQDDGRLVIAGEFTTVNGDSHGRIVRLNGSAPGGAGMEKPPGR